MVDAGADGRAKRDSVFRTAVITDAAGNCPIECRVRNVSPTGAGVSHRGQLRTGMAITIAIGKTPAVPARVVWATEAQAGIAFGAAPVADEPKFEDYVPTVHAGWLSGIDDPYRR